MLYTVFLNVLLQASRTFTIDHLINWGFDKIVVLGKRIILAVIFYLIARWAILWIRKIVRRILSRKKIDNAVSSFVNSAVNMTLQVMMVMVIISILGIETTSFAAILATAGLAIGMAMKDNLSNFAGGVMILMNKPFGLGDRISAQSMDGVVQEIGILYTILLTSDNRTIYIPNGPLSTGSIINYSTQEYRRLDITYNFNNGNNPDEIKKLLNQIIEANDKVEKSRTPFIGLTMLNNGNFDVVIRVWTKNSNYGTLNVELNEDVYRKLSARGIYGTNVLSVKMQS